jgi:hypothetical protein
MRKDEILIEINGLLVIFLCIDKVAEDKVELGAMVIDVRIIFVDTFGGLEVLVCQFLFTYLDVNENS